MPLRRFSRRTRERTEWVGAIQVGPTVVAANTQSNKILIDPIAMEEWPGGRIDRLIGQMFFSPATGPIAASGYGIFFGFQVDGPALFFDPELAPDHRWIHWDSCYPQIGGTGAADANSARWIGYFRFGFDLRIRRRLDADKQFSLVVKNSNASAASIQYSYAFRILVAAGRK